ncbi:type B 50S ribosomal protein L31 [Serinibacter salmoneus]|uniref:50S ribosomal protein L31 n=1 Tax=Serinibacter salmoneus TaxID=556530 RepID=A0A2A9D4W2_9MICO|nr:type B 50S ribosomal protein L31 [Serinibacter salmoneus]PFG20992.1 large subunit ribosomal protein L31 [Serinibacter salmoneus]
MKKNIHPAYGPVVFRDVSVPEGTPGREFLTSSTLVAAAPGGAGGQAPTTVWEDGNTYPVIEVQVSSVSHPFYTGKQKIVDTAGRVEKFRRRYGARGAAEPAAPEGGAR